MSDRQPPAPGGLRYRLREPLPLLRRGAGAVRTAWREGRMGSLPVALGLVAIWITFTCIDTAFLSTRNLSNMSVDLVGLGLITIGVIFVLLVGDIDLSVGSVSGLAAAIFAQLNVYGGVPEWLAGLVALLAGAAAGAVHGFFVARVGVPAFVVTLAGLLAWNGLMLLVLDPRGSIELNDQGLIASLTNRYLAHPAFPLTLAALGVAAHLVVALSGRHRRTAAGLPARPLAVVLLRAALWAALLFTAAGIFIGARGLPLAFLIFMAVLVGSDFLLRRTTYGRKIFALGGGIEAARRAGIAVVAVRMSVFVVSGAMAALGGLFLASRIASVGQTSGSGDLVIDVIAAAVIGGVSLFGGRGTVWAALLGAAVIESIASGMALLGVTAAVQFMITGCVLLAAVVLDSMARQAQQTHGRA